MIDLSPNKVQLREDAKYLLKLSDSLATAVRSGAEEDVPEGSRYVTLTDTLSSEISGKLREIANRL
jgi:hypothetical protein